MSERSKGRGQTKRSPWSSRLRVGREDNNTIPEKILLGNHGKVQNPHSVANSHSRYTYSLSIRYSKGIITSFCFCILKMKGAITVTVSILTIHVTTATSATFCCSSRTIQRHYAAAACSSRTVSLLKRNHNFRSKQHDKTAGCCNFKQICDNRWFIIPILCWTLSTVWCTVDTGPTSLAYFKMHSLQSKE
jgi:hypothetical protein